jgi:hypothetical protein
MTLQIIHLDPNSRPAFLMTTDNTEMESHQVETREDAARIVFARVVTGWKLFRAELWHDGVMLDDWNYS